MAVSNYTLAYANAPSPFAASVTPSAITTQLDDLLYSPELHQDASPPRENEPYSQPARRAKKKRGGAPYLPPPGQFTHYPREPSNPYMHTQLYDNPRLSVQEEQHSVREMNGPYHQTSQGQYVHDASGDYDSPPLPQSRTPPQPAPDYTSYGTYENYPPEGQNYFQSAPRQLNPQLQQPIQPSLQSQSHPIPNHEQLQPSLQPSHQQHQTSPQLHQSHHQHQPNHHQPQPSPQLHQIHHQHLNPQQNHQTPAASKSDGPATRPPGFTKVEVSSGGSNTKTQVHAVLDYDDDYYDDVPGEGGVNLVQQPVTPLQGPILLKNGTVPVVPLFSYPTVNNGSYYQIPILWTALSLALGYELKGQVIKGVPCVKRNYQLYCPTAGNTYPLEKIECFIDENKALMKRMYGAFGSGGPSPGGSRKRRRAPGVPDPHPDDGDSYFRSARQAAPPPLTPNQGNSSNRNDACESKTEIVTPYWALNSARKLRAVVNTMHFEQAIHQEVCSKTTTSRCAGDCGCEQKYKWHRLLAYDPDEDCSGIFMDWFLFPSCCVCRCSP